MKFSLDFLRPSTYIVSGIRDDGKHISTTLRDRSSQKARRSGLEKLAQQYPESTILITDAVRLRRQKSN